MLLLDTNVLSEVMGRNPAPAVAAFIASQPLALLYTAAVSQAEVMTGIAVLPEGRRRAELAAAAKAIFGKDFGGRILPFDERAAAAYGDLFAVRQKLGRPATTMDLMIAAIARSQGASVVTRDVGGFEGCGVTVINAWLTAGESRT